MISRYAAGFCAEPQIAVGGTEHQAEAVGGEPGHRAFVEDGEAKAIKPREAVESRDPEIAVRSLVNAADNVLRETIVGGKGLKAMLRARGNYGRRQKEQESKEANLPNAARIDDAKSGLCRLRVADCHRPFFFLVAY